MLNYTIFKQLVDKCVIKHSKFALPFSVDAQDEAKLFYSEYEDKFNEILKDKKIIIWEDCYDLQKSATLEIILNDTEISIYFEVLDKLKATSRTTPEHDTLDTEDPALWEELISISLILLDTRKIIYPNYHPHLIPRQVMLAQSVKYLLEHNLPVDITDYQFFVSDTNMATISGQIEKLIKMIGGENVIGMLLNRMEKSFHEEQQRYHLGRDTPGIYKTPTPQFPLAYIFRLAVKHFFNRPETHDTTIYWKELYDLARHFTALFDVQPTSMYENMGGYNQRKLAHAIRDLIVYDSLFTFEQANPIHIGDMLEGILSDGFMHLELESGITVRKTLMVVKAVMELTQGIHRPVEITVCNIRRRLSKSISNTNILLILDSMLSIKSENILNGYLTPQDSLQNDIYDFPIIKHSNKFCFVNRHVFSWSFINSILNKARVAYLSQTHKNDFDILIGNSLEKYILKRFQLKNIHAFSGRYSINKVQYDCDLVIDYGDKIIFGEVKKKTLRRSAKSGNATDALNDLCESLIRSTNQTLRHEINLRKQGKLTLTAPDGSQNTIEYQGQRILRLSISLFDFGAFNYRTIPQLLRGLTGVRFNAVNPKDQQDLDSLNKRCGELHSNLLELIALDSAFERNCFFDNVFLSLPQILMLLDDSYDTESFFTAFLRNHHLLSGSSDFYRDYSYWKELPARAAAERQEKQSIAGCSAPE